MLVGLSSLRARLVPLRSANRVGFNTSQDRLSLVQGVKRVVQGHRSRVAIIHPGVVNSRLLSAFGSRSVPGPIASRVPIGTIFGGKVAPSVTRAPFRAPNWTGGFNAITRLINTTQPAPAAVTQAQGDNTAGLPSGAGSYANPIMVPGTSVVAAKSTPWLLYAGLAVVVYMLVGRR